MLIEIIVTIIIIIVFAPKMISNQTKYRQDTIERKAKSIGLDLDFKEK